MKLIKIIILSFGLIISSAFAQSTQDIIKKAMKDELKRSITNLSLEKLKKPFFISYTIVDSKQLSIKASLGGILSSKDEPGRTSNVRVLVGDYNLNNENFVDMGSGSSSMMQFGGSGQMPLDDDYYGIRRTLWLATDEKYKGAAESIEAKLSAMKQQNLSAEDSLPDFCKVKITELTVTPQREFSYSKEKWETIAKDLSEIFKNYKDIFSSSVAINFFTSTIYFINSEGTETIQPFTIAAVQVNAGTMADDGEPLSDHVLYYELNPDDLPSVDAIKNDIKAMADNLAALRKAPVFDESYSGPALFEGQAVAEAISQRFMSENGGLISSRKGIYSNPQILMFMSQAKDKSLDDKIDKKVVSNWLTIKASPMMKKYGKKNLIGNYQADAEGVVLNEELILINQGILKTMLSGRIPNQNVKQSNGHCGYKFAGQMLLPDEGPSVIDVYSSQTTSEKELRKKLIEKAKEEGLKYTYVVSKVKCSNSGSSEGFNVSSIMSMAGDMQKKGGLSKPIAITRINVETGKEELVRGASIGGLTVGSFKKLLGVSDDIFVYNTLHSDKGGGGLSSIFSIAFEIGGGQAGGLSGKPASFLVPTAMLLEELDIQKDKRAITSKLPIVENPVGR